MIENGYFGMRLLESATTEARRPGSNLGEARAAELAARNAGRPVLMAVLERVKIGSVAKAHARTISSALLQIGGKAGAAHLVTLT